VITAFINRFKLLFPLHVDAMPWTMTNNLSDILMNIMPVANDDYVKDNDVMIHKTAIVENNVVLKGPVIIGANSFVGANAYLRGPLFLDDAVRIGAGCEIKQSMIFSNTAVAHFNYIGNCVIGSEVNFEAGSVAANHFNERKDRNITVVYNGTSIDTHTEKFGALVGDGCRIGANAVLSPGTILLPGSIVNRLELIDQSVK
jgi:bifunctional N-acetylglucosamine-1-phosphate-uridyltransferase/glucosamine-1-phosphate-acetyltransferase GlmU-like protein